MMALKCPCQTCMASEYLCLRRIERKREEAKNLTSQLERQLCFESRFRIKPHEIAGITLRPMSDVEMAEAGITAADKGPENTSSEGITYSSIVTMRDGTTHTLTGVNAGYLLGSGWPGKLKPTPAAVQKGNAGNARVARGGKREQGAEKADLLDY